MSARTWLDELSGDVRFGARSLVSTPAVTCLAVLSLALGIMSATAMYSVVHAVVLDPFPYKDVDRLMSVEIVDADGRGGRMSYPTDEFLEIAERNRVFEGTIASTISDVLWTGDGDPQRLRGNHGTMNTFRVMGVPPRLGRVPTDTDAAPEAPPVVVLGYRFWQRQFGGDAAVLGRELTLNGVTRTVIGVMPKRFMWRGADVYVPLVFERGKVLEGVRRVHLLGRLKAGATRAEAQADLRPILEELQRREPSHFPQKWRVELASFTETFPSSIRETLWILFGAVGLLLLIACVNVSNLLLSRGAARRKELAVRAALGARRGRLVRQLLAESLLLAGVGGALGVPLAYASLRAIVSLVPPDTIPDESEIAINGVVLLFTLVVSMGTALVFGLAPAWHGSRVDLADTLKDSARSASGGRGQTRMRNVLVVAEVALSMILLVGAALMLRTVRALQNVDHGIRADRVLTLRVPLPETRYPDSARRSAFMRALLERVAAMPSVAAAGVNTGMHPFGNFATAVEVRGQAATEARPVVIHQVDGGYFAALGIRLVQGRLFGATDVDGREPLAIVNETFVRSRLADGRILGETVRVPGLRMAPWNLEGDAFQIIGVVKDTLNRGLRNELQPELYLPYSLAGRADRLAVLTRLDPRAVMPDVRAQVYAIDKDQPVTDMKTIGAVLDDFTFSGARFSFVLFSIFAALGLLLAVIGVYGVISHAVSRRAREIGVRIAIGASTAQIVRAVVVGGVKLIAAGIGIGFLASAASAKLVQQLVWKVSPFDPLSFVAVAGVLLVAGVLACLWPALRAARIDPLSTLRGE
jgi:putative ABC transport system permease protein